ncbi:uncharacterized protein LOC129219164 [Uloborus diversus]|uniref:uncharacterized protein LOC129219164 n=1 Tax=Uloborus diversus TaxID=327109 RepID=UPI0024091094|nr:uncharacterized protein LOC129219164 [Uloborus diversus]
MVSVFVVAAAILFLGLAHAEPVPFNSCINGDNILSLSIEPCNPVLVDDWATCVLQHGSEVNVEAAFIAPFDSSELETVSFANIASRLVPLPATGTDPCIGDLSPSCPIKEGRMYIYSTIFDILKYFPAVNTARGPMEVMFSIRDRNSKSTVGCAKLPVIIQRNPSFTYKKRNISS